MRKVSSNTRQSKWFTFILYPENNSHMEILNFLLDEKIQEMQEFAVAGMVHDRCIYLEGENKGKKKKSHVHVILKTKERHTSSAIAKMMGGQRTVFRLYQRDENQEHDTKVNRSKDKDAEFERHFYASTGKEYPVLIDGYDEKQPVDIEISSEVWANINSGKIGNWDSLPEVYYNNPDYPQFQCKKNQYWKIIKTQDVNHVEIISDPKAYYLYLQHKDLASLRAGKVGYAESEFFGSSELLEEMRGNRSLKYQLTQLFEYFESCGVTNAKQAYESLLYGEHTEDMLNFFWSNVSKFYSYFRSFENQNFCEACSSETRSRERKEYYAEEYKQTAGKLRNEYKLIIDAIKQTKKATPEQTARLQDIAHWFSMHPEQTLFSCPPIEEQKMNAEIKKVMHEKYAPSDVEDASEPAPVLTSDDECYPLIE